jgi:phosphatidylserine/phosphatidylglycerophosphate/cardiolipin synthase-like enzyme
MITQRLKSSLPTGLAYGFGLAAGSIVAQLIFLSVRLPEQPLLGNAGLRLVVGVLLIFAIAILGGGIGGFIGGWTLPMVGRIRGRWGYAWHSALSLGLPFGTALYLLVFIFYILIVGDRSGLDAQQSTVLFAILGGFFGIAAGLLLGLSTVGRRFLRIVLAGLVGFAIGGIGLGLAIWYFFLRLPRGALAYQGPYGFLLLGLFLFGLCGGTALGFAFDSLSSAPTPETKPASRRTKIVRGVLAVGLLLFVVVALWPLLVSLQQVLTPRDANHSPILDTNVDGAHWLYQERTPAYQSANARGSSVAASAADRVALTWIEEGDPASLQYASGTWIEEQGEVIWHTPSALSTPGEQVIVDSQVIHDVSGSAHVMWLESTPEKETSVYYARCDEASCSGAIQISDSAGSACDEGGNVGNAGSTGTIAVDRAGTVAAVWESSTGGLEAAAWAADAPAPSPARDCVVQANSGPSKEPRLAVGPDGALVLAYNAGGDITIASLAPGSLASSPEVIGSGSNPEVYVDNEGGIHAAWCAGETGIGYWDGTATQKLSGLACTARPGIGQDSEGRIHAVFSSNDLVGNPAVSSSTTYLYETIRKGNEWTRPMIVALPGGQAQPSLASSEQGILHLAWSEKGEEQETLAFASQLQYGCQGYDLSGAAGAVLEVAARPEYRSLGNPIAYCQNRYDQLIFTPNPSPQFSEHLPTSNGGFDQMASLISGAQFEVLVSTMAYEKAVNGGGAGIVLGEAIAELYRQLKADPARYPRGITVRILLGNSPPFATMELNSQLWELLGDLRRAGVETMVDPDLGWRLEVANYAGAFPHSHTKVLVVDGKVVATKGFNLEFRPLPLDHPSGQGKGDTDLGVQVTGPVAQDALRVFDDLWDGAVQRHCSDLSPPFGLWQLTCRDRPATADHVPEVMRYYLGGGDTEALSMYRSKVHDAADQEVYAALASAEESIDVMHVSFSFPLLCGLNHFFQLCTYEHAPRYIVELVDAVEDSGVKARVLVGALPFQGVENSVAVDLLRREVKKRGLEDQVEFRFFDGLVHNKTILVDEEFLVVGSQNFHYSAFGKGKSLTEHSIGLVDPEAVQDFKRLFDYHWDRSKD